MPLKKSASNIKNLKPIEFREAQDQQFFEKNTLKSDKESFIAGISKMRELFIKPFNVVQGIVDDKYPKDYEHQEALIQYSSLSQREHNSSRILVMNEIYRQIINYGKSKLSDQLLNAMKYLMQISESDAKTQLGLPSNASGAKAYVEKVCNALKKGQTIEEEADLKVELYE